MEETLSKYSSDNFLLPSANCVSQISTQSVESPHKEICENQNRNTDSVSQDVPWKIKDCYSCGVIGLHEEINEFFDWMRPTEQEIEIRMRVIEHITKVVHSMWPHAKVEIFGSFRTGLYLPSGDIDMVINGEWRGLPLSTLGKALQQSGISEKDIDIIEHAKVPIVRLQHTPTRVKVDISFNKMNGVEKTKMLKNLMKQYPALPKLLMVLKQFLAQKGLNEVHNGGVGSYCLTILIVSLLRSYQEPKALTSKNLGTVLLEFFELYGINFNYEKVSIQSDGSYQPKSRTTGTPLDVEDPTQKGNNIGKGTFLIPELKSSFENAFHDLHKAVTNSAATKQPLNSYLSLIIRVDESLWKERKWMAQNYSTILQKLSNLMDGPRLNDLATASPDIKKRGKGKTFR